MGIIVIKLALILILSPVAAVMGKGEEIDLDFNHHESDDLESLKKDIGEITPKKGNESNEDKGEIEIFDVGEEEKKLLELVKRLAEKIPESDWQEIAASSRPEKYVVQKGDWLWKISKKLFGTGFYYSKIWSLNPHIKNPHEIEPGMVLLFNTGDEDEMPSVSVKNFEDLEEERDVEDVQAQTYAWAKERKKLIEQGVFFQYASEETYEDLIEAGRKSLNKEYEKYEPPQASFNPIGSQENYDSVGIDLKSKIHFSFKEGFFLTTFITSNVVQDLGEIEAIAEAHSFIIQFDKIYVKFDETVKVKPGDLFSVYSAEGKITHELSEREGYRYTIKAQIKALRPKETLWECLVTELSGIVERKSRITTYTPKIGHLLKTFSRRSIEGLIVDAFRDTSDGISYGDVVYLDRGRADGVENGTVFEIFSSTDEGTGKRITFDPTYKIGEISVISLTDNFSTALVTNSSSVMTVGDVAFSKTLEDAARASHVKNEGILKKEIEKMKGEDLKELDIELNLDDIGQDLLDQADKVQLTDEELEELERQEREQSVIREEDRDIRELDRIERDIEEAEDLLNEAKFDKDKLLEREDLNSLEKRIQAPDPNAFESLDELEKELGLKFLDEDLNSKENPYGLTEFDLEEVDELMNEDELTDENKVMDKE